MSLSNVAGALHSPKGMTVNCHSPELVVNIIYTQYTNIQYKHKHINWNVVIADWLYPLDIGIHSDFLPVYFIA